jgi:hypothetical protein
MVKTLVVEGYPQTYDIDYYEIFAYKIWFNTTLFWIPLHRKNLKALDILQFDMQMIFFHRCFVE